MTEEEFFDRVACGEAVHKLLSEKGAPRRFSQVKVLSGHPWQTRSLWDKYARAKIAAQHKAVEELRELAATTTSENVHSRRLEIDVIKWQAAKLAPK